MYRLLGLTGEATQEEVKRAYRKLAKRYHPDLTRNIRDGEYFAKIADAYKTLSVVTRRRSLIDFPVRETRKPEPPKTKPAPPKEVSIFALGKLLEEGKTTGMRVFAARCLGNTGKRSVYPFLRKSLYDADDLVVKSSVEAIGKLRIQQCAGELGSVFLRGNKDIKLLVLAAVENIGMRGDFRNILIAAMKDGDPDIRKLSLKMYTVAV